MAAGGQLPGGVVRFGAMPPTGPPQSRIVSLVPSLTELVCWLGAGAELAGRTRFCTEPAELVRGVPIVGGTKNPHLDRIAALRPTLVLANKEENRKEDVLALREAGLDVLVTDPNSVSEAVAMVRELGQRLDRQAKAESLATETEGAAREGPAGRRPRVFVAVWKEPFMGLARDTYGHDLIELAGAENVLRGRPRYPEITREELAALAPGLILLPDEPYPFTAADADSLAAIAPARVIDGKLLWWYGPRMPAAIRELRRLFATAAGR